MQRSSSGYEPPADKLYDQPLLGFVRTKNAYTEKQQNQLPQNTVEATLNLQNKCSLEDNTEGEEDGSWHEADPKRDLRKEKLLGTQEESEGREEGSSQDQEKPKAEKKEDENAESKVQAAVNLCIISNRSFFFNKKHQITLNLTAT